ncbi:hypothetical protein GQ44DRAFT_795340 [Phaeosphaeriaceae sp. PMI808]|nr:hypothetical protein GQ44DRAFT_795340 [Phaeosphaeriaceae sp. PMI808]
MALTPISASSDSNEAKSFHTVFEENMASSRKPISHDSASVLLLSYETNDEHPTNLDVRDEVKQLEDVFRKDYGFHVEQQLIKSDKSAQVQMSYYLSNLTYHHGHEHALLIVYYAGHGWRSSDERRLNPGRFDFLPRKLGKDQIPSGDELVMWEMSEKILLDVKSDVLVIFDCCDAGAVAKLRSSGRVFEYLGACTGHKYTYKPGENSFTSALTWALKELSSEPPFTTDHLVSKIKQYRWFPDNQTPVLIPRYDYLPEHIWISSRQTLTTPTPSQRRWSSIPEFRDDICDYADFRVTFSRPLSDEDGKTVAELMKPLVANKELQLSARHVAFLKKGTCKPRVNLGPRWARLRTQLRALHRIQRPADNSITIPNHKRKRSSLEIQLERSGQMKYAKPSLAVETDCSTQPISTPSIGNEDLDLEETKDLQTGNDIQSTPIIVQSFYETESDCASQIKASLEELEKLMQETLHQPEVHRFLQEQIQSILNET